MRILVAIFVAGCRFGFDARVALDDGSPGRPCSVGFDPPVLISGVNTAGDEYAPFFASNGLEIYFYSTRAGGLGGSDIWHATRASTSTAFGPAEPVPNINTASNEGGESLTEDGLAMFFSSGRAGGLGLDDVWVATRTSVTLPFGAPVNVPEVSSAGSEFDINISPDGLVLYLSSDRAGGAGAFDIYRATRASRSSAFSPVVNVAELNTASGEGGAMPSRDGLSLVFFSSRTDGPQFDLYITSRPDPTGPFDPPQRASISATGEYDLGTILSPDAQTLGFGSSRPGGSGGVDLWLATRTCP